MTDYFSEDNAPRITQDLIEYLSVKFPNTIPTDNVSVEELRYLQGQQSIINHLLILMKMG